MSNLKPVAFVAFKCLQPVGLGHHTMVPKLGQDLLESPLELLLRGIWGQWQGSGMLEAMGWGENRGMLERLAEDLQYNTRMQ